MPKYKTKQEEIEAVQFTNPQNVLAVKSLAGHNFNLLNEPDEDDPDFIAELFATEHSEWLGVALNDWIIKDSKGNLTVLDPEEFEEKYEASGKSPSRK